MAKDDNEKGHEDAVKGQAHADQNNSPRNTGKGSEYDKLTRKHQKSLGNMSKSDESTEPPPGGFSATPVAHAPPGYTVKITFHRAENLPMADLVTMSSDPYCLAELQTELRKRHKEDPTMVFRTHTIWKSTSPEWNEEWVVAHVPASGFRLKVRLYDEDATDRNDRLGNAHVHVANIDEHWGGIKDQGYKIKKRMGSKRAYALRGIAVCLGRAHEMSGRLFVSVKVLGKSPGDEGGRAYTTGLNYWCQHRSPLLGRIAGRKDNKHPDVEKLGPGHLQQSRPDTGMSSKSSSQSQSHTNKTETYDFQANQFQLTGPVPPDLYHHFVEFKPWIGTLFKNKGLRGRTMHTALHKQHIHVYNYNRQTRYGVFDGPSISMTQQFLDLVHYDQGGRIFTYILTLDGLMRFTETGKEFGIDMLSKHTMHSDASIYIAFSGEFFLRRAKRVDDENNIDASPPVATPSAGGEDEEPRNRTSTPPPPSDSADTEEHPSKDPRHYELIIDNDSGTYRPNKKLLPQLKEFMQKNFPRLHIITLDSQDDEKLMKKWKDHQRKRKEAGGKGMVYTQGSARSSMSSSDEEELDRVEEGNQEAGGRLGMVKEVVGPLKKAIPSIPNPKDWVSKGREVDGHEGERGEGGIDPMKA